MRGDLIQLRPQGLYCPMGDFYIDPWRPVERAIVTHAHADHARHGPRHIIASRRSLGLLRSRLGPAASMMGLDWGQRLRVGEAMISFHPASHVLGAAQIRIEHRGEVWVASGDYRVVADASCDAFEPVRCHTFITESTFGLPIYRWAPQTQVIDQVVHWWQANAAQCRPSVLLAYSLGKAQRLLAALPHDLGPIVVHSTVEALNAAYRAEGVRLAPCQMVSETSLDKGLINRALVIAPPGATKGPWMQRFAKGEVAMVSGWMQLRGTRRREGLDRGFALSDHADWPGLIQAIGATGAERVIVTHGHVAPLVRWLQEQGLEAGAFETQFGDEAAESAATVSPEALSAEPSRLAP